MQINKRVQNLRARFSGLKIDAALVSSTKNRYYLSGFDGSAGYLLITDRKAILATDFRYVEQAGREAPDYEIYKTPPATPDWLAKLLAELNIKNLGFEETSFTVEAYDKLKDRLAQNNYALNLLPLKGSVEELRSIKEPEEITLIRQAIRIAEAALAHIAKTLKPGMTELAVAWEIEKFMRENSSQSLPFEVIVASGPNAALPHAKPSARVINEGEPVIADIGARVGGYASDLTRTFCPGKQGAKFKELYNLTLKAQQTAIEGVTAGMTGEQADYLARQVIEQAGYADNFGHGLGHGIGLETHEAPRLGIKSEDVLQENMVFTIEPGVYVSGWGGIRIEDDILLKKGKARVLSQAAK